VAVPADRRWAWAEVDLGAIGHNVETLKALTPSETLFMAVVKADGYGHGASEVAQAALAAGADRLGVATVDEGVRLRKAGITAPVQILSEPPASRLRRCLCGTASGRRSTRPSSLPHSPAPASQPAQLSRSI